MQQRQLTKERDKSELIERLSAKGAVLALYFADLDDPPSCVELVAEHIAIISPPYTYSELSDWWYYGNWNLVSPATKEFQPLDCFKATEAEVENAMIASGVTLLIDCFHDDTDWYVTGDA